ncbi:His/Gly/Thr/Pro-type tRNA ligase C-terminal domain-containing protein [Patescibacteria group bacterium]
MKKGVIKPEIVTPTRVLVLPMTDDISSSLEIATELRKKGIPTEVSFIQGKMKKRLGYANKLSIPYAVFIGEDEISKGVYTLKDLSSGKQDVLKREDLLARLLS